MFKTISAILCLSLILTLAAGEFQIKNKNRVAFLGDSITQQGQRREAGYVNLVIQMLKSRGVTITPIKAGISGHKSNQMLARLQKDVINKKADFLFLSCGVNDVWHGKRGVPLEQYKKNITAIVEKAQKAGIKVCIMTATMIGEDPNNANNKKLAAYNDFLRKLASEKKCLLADTNAAMQKALAALKKEYPKSRGPLLTSDGVHMSPAVDMMMARCLLETVGIPKGEIDFTKLPCKGEVRLMVPLSFYNEIYKRNLSAGGNTGNVDRQINLSVRK